MIKSHALPIALIAGLSLAVAGCGAQRDNRAASPTPTPTAATAASPEATAQAAASEELPEREEFRQSYQLAPGAKVEIDGFRGHVLITTAETRTAEVYILRRANNRGAFAARQMKIEHTPVKLKLEMDRVRRSVMFSVFGENADERQEVTIKLPRQVNLEIDDIGGRVEVGEIEGKLEIDGVSGRVEVARVTGPFEMDGINGGARVTVARLAVPGLNIDRVNGNVDLQFENEVNAELLCDRINGRVNADLPKVAPDARNERSRYYATIGRGGPRIEISRINGVVNLTKAGAAPAPSPTAPAR